MSLDVYLKLPSCFHCGRDEETVFSANITHNLNSMATEAGIYEAVWRPDENNITKAWQVGVVLRPGLERMKADPHHYRLFNPINNWGSYDSFVEWLENYLEACEKYPEATVHTCR